MTFISGENISEQCDIIYAGNKTEPTTKKVIRHWETLDEVQDNDIVFCKTDFVGSCCTSIRVSGKSVHLVTHDSDINITKDVFDAIDNDNIISWHGMNIDHVNDKLFSIPIGIANGYCDITMKMNDIETKEIEPSKLLYINHRIETCPDERSKPYEIFKTNDWCTVHHPSDKGVIEEYRAGVTNHKYVLCPRGNGIDTHRMWETLYSGRIPIVKRCVNTSFYEDYPILIIDDYSELNKDMLESNYDRISKMEFNKELLTVEWWIKKIKELYYEQTQGSLL